MKIRYLSHILVSTLLLVFGISTVAQITVPGEVVEVIDGKTVVVAIATGKVKVELQYIDVPSPDLPIGDMVRIHLRNLVLGKKVDFRARTIQKDRTTGLITLNGVDVSQQMLRDGAAWLIPVSMSAQDGKENELYASTQAAAKSEKAGVWAVPGLKPTWEILAEKREGENDPKQYYSVASINGPQRVTIPKGGGWSDINPKLGNVGALLSGYNAASKGGFVGTPWGGLTSDPNSPDQTRSVIQFTYFYKEDEHKGRKGMVVFTLSALSKKARFVSDNALVIIGGGPNINLGKAKRTSSPESGGIRENLSYQISKSALTRLINDQTYMKVSDYVVILIGTRYLLNSMVDVVD